MFASKKLPIEAIKSRNSSLIHIVLNEPKLTKRIFLMSFHRLGFNKDK